MSKKKLPNLLDSRLDSLFVDLEQDAAYLPCLIDKQLPGWTWECDIQGRYTSCGSEVEIILGLHKEDFIGQPLAKFALHSDCQQNVQTAVEDGISPVKINVNYLDISGKIIPTLFHLLNFSTEKDGGKIRGFVQVVDSHPLPHLTTTIIENFWQDSLAARSGEGENRAVLTVPLRLPDKSTGLLEILDDNPDRYWTSDERKLVEQVADQLSQALEMAYLYQETNQRVQELDLLFGVSQSLSEASMNQAEIASIVAQSLAEVMNAPFISILLWEPEQNSWRVLARYNLHLEKMEEDSLTLIPSLDLPDLDEIKANPKTIRYNYSDMESTHGFRRYMELNGQKVVLFIPMVVQGQLIGMIEIGSHAEEYSCTNSQINLATAVANAAAVALENARLYEEQRRATEKLREVDKLKSSFLANMSHELRTPLNSIIGFSRVILKGIDGPITELQQQDLNAIHNSGAHLLNLINNVLDISKIEAGRMELVFEDNIDLALIIESVFATTQALIKDKPVSLEKHVQPDLPLLRVDTTRIRQVFLNLLSNAAKFTEKGSIILYAHLQNGENGQPGVIVKVTDTGIGITPENQTRLFQPFSQVDESPTRKAGGSGLGLSISRLLIEMHGGKIGVSSEVGAGSTFFFTLPIQSELDK
jgi:signal transduction histidine kinase